MRILIVAWAWPPVGRVGALRPLGMAREWIEAGHEVHVLTGPGDRGGEPSPDLLPAIEKLPVVTHRAPAPGISNPGSSPHSVARRRPRPRRISRVRQILGQWKGFPDLQRSWIRPATRLGVQVHLQSPFDVVWSTSPPESVHFVARHLARRGVPWVADFRDPWSDYLFARWDPLSRRVINLISAWTLRAASAVMANSAGIADSIRRAARRDVRCVRNGFDPMTPSDRPPLARTLGYFGRIDPLLQRPEQLWPALQRMLEQGEPWKVDFFLTAGGSGGRSSLSVPASLSPFVQVFDPLPYPAARVRMQEMTALLVLCLAGRGHAIVPGKLYDYIGAARPALVCAPAGYEARMLVEHSGTGIGAWGDDELSAALVRLEQFQVNRDGRESFSREAQARRALEIFERVSC